MTAKQPCISSRETEAAVNAASKPSTGLNCDIVMSRHSKFVWPGIDAILEAYASHVEGNDNDVLEHSEVLIAVKLMELKHSCNFTKIFQMLSYFPYESRLAGHFDLTHKYLMCSKWAVNLLNLL